MAETISVVQFEKNLFELDGVRVVIRKPRNTRIPLIDLGKRSPNNTLLKNYVLKKLAFLEAARIEYDVILPINQEVTEKITLSDIR